MAADYQFQSQAEWGTGEFTNCAAVDPAGKLTPSVAPETLAELVAANHLSVYLRCREGSGTIVDNVATAGEDGTLSNADAWQTRADGRHYLTGRNITVPYFAGMKVVDDNDHSWSYAAQMRVRYAGYTAEVVLQRGNRFRLGIDATGHPYVQNHYHISEVDNEEHILDIEGDEWWYLGHTQISVSTFVMTGHNGAAYELDAANGKVKFSSAFEGTVEVDYYHHEEIGWTAEADCKDDDTLSLNEWHKLSVVCSNGYLSLYLDDAVVATLETYYSDNDPETDLVAACTGDWSDIMYVGEAESACLVRFPIQGSWSKEIELGTDKTLRYLELDTAFTRLEHSINVVVAFADSAAELDYARAWSWSVRETGTTVYFPPELGLLHGTWMKITISISEEDYDRDAVLVDALRIWVRTPATVLYDYERSPHPGILVPEFGIPEDLKQLIANVKALFAVTNELSREISEVRTYAERGGGLGGGFGGGLGGGFGGGTPGAATDEEDWAAEINRRLEQHTREFWFWLPLIKKDHEHVGYLMQKASFLDARRAVHWDWIMENMRGLATTTSDLAAHAALGTGTHDLAAGKYFLGSDSAHMTGQALISAHNHILGKHGAGAADKVGKPAVNDHAALTTGVHGAGASTLATAANIATHAGLTTGVHGVGASSICSTLALATHETARQNVHGVGGSYVAAIVHSTNTVEAEIESYGYATTSALSSHASAATGIHGVGASNICSTLALAQHESASTWVHAVGGSPVASEDYADDAVSDHEGSATAHGSVESNFASHKDDHTNVHGCAHVAEVDDITSAIGVHQAVCGNWTG